jgi:hypothetical protein
VTDDDGGRRDRGAFGPMERLDDVQRQAIEAAMRVAGQFSGLAGGLGESGWTTPPDAESAGSVRDATARVDVGRMRGDVARAAETFVELMRSMMDVGFDALDELARRPAPHPGGTVAPGSITRIECTVRNDRSETVRSARPLVHGLVSGVGEQLDAAVTVTPAELDLDAHERAAITIEVHVSPVASPGHYHGLLLVSGVPDLAVPVSVAVVDPEAAP